MLKGLVALFCWLSVENTQGDTRCYQPCTHLNKFINNQVSEPWESIIKETCTKIFWDSSQEHIEIWAATSWAIWYSRNQLVHGHPLPSPQDTIDLASRLLNDFHKVNAVQSMAHWCTIITSLSWHRVWPLVSLCSTQFPCCFFWQVLCPSH